MRRDHPGGELPDGDFDTSPWPLSEFSDDESARLIYVAGNHDAYNIGLAANPERLQRLRDETGNITFDREVIEIEGC